MSTIEPTYSEEELFAIEIRDFPGQSDSYFEACDTLQRLMSLFLRNAASSTPPGEVVDMEDLESANREVYKQAVGHFYIIFGVDASRDWLLNILQEPFVTALEKLVDMVGQNERWFMARMKDVERGDWGRNQ